MSKFEAIRFKAREAEFESYVDELEQERFPQDQGDSGDDQEDLLSPDRDW